jgi:hypothetical protein
MLFVNGNKLAGYDFSDSEQEMSSISDKLKPSYIEKVDKRLFLGKR